MQFHQAPHTFVGRVDLRIADLERSLQFYQDVIGFRVLERLAKKAILTADGKNAILSIEQPDNVLPMQPRTTGLYHFALLLPSRADLAKVVRYFIETRCPVQGASDHLVSEALYLADPDGNGIEIYADRPAEAWQWDKGQVTMATEPLDIEGLLAEDNGEARNGLPANTVMGHIHLHVSELQETERFYTQGLGFEIVTRYGSQALFISTGKYHHHIGLNTWAGIGAPAPKENSVGLKWFAVVYPNEEARKEAVERLQKLGAWTQEQDGVILTKDPSGNHIRLSIMIRYVS